MRRVGMRIRPPAVALAALTATALCAEIAPRARSVGSLFPLPSTFNTDAPGASAAPYVGAWTDGRTRLALVPRRCVSKAVSCLYGTIPDGAREGALLFELADRSPATGVLVRATEALDRTEVTLHLRDPATLQVLSNGGSVTLRRAGGVDIDALAAVPIIAHRAMSLGVWSLANSARAIEYAWLFGASGVEIDIVVPYTVERRARRPLPLELRVHHPPVARAELTGFDSSPLAELHAALRPATALSLAARHHVPLVYIDPKLRWIQRNDAAMRQALGELVRLAQDATDRDRALHVVIGAETNRAADLLAARTWPASSPRVGWAQEFTRGTAVDRALNHARAAPEHRSAALSLNLLAVRGGRTGLLGWFVPNLDRHEPALSRLEQPLIFWTADSDAQFEGALEAARRLGAGDPRRPFALMTPRPHRLAYYLATRGTNGR